MSPELAVRPDTRTHSIRSARRKGGLGNRGREAALSAVLVQYAPGDARRYKATERAMTISLYVSLPGRCTVAVAVLDRT